MSLPKTVVLFDPVCKHCQQHLMPGTLCWAVGKPYHILLHENCAPYFDYQRGYPHNQPYQYYVEKSRGIVKDETHF